MTSHLHFLSPSVIWAIYQNYTYIQLKLSHKRHSLNSVLVVNFTKCPVVLVKITNMDVVYSLYIKTFKQ